jgi:hypothetical protein
MITALLCCGLYRAQAQFIRASLQAAGLTCSMCSRATQDALSQLPFVQDIVPDLNTNTFVITFKKGVPVHIDALKDQVVHAGFSVAKLTLTANFDHVSVGKETHINYHGNIIHFVEVKPQVLEGDRVIRVIDKGFLPDKQFKKYETVEGMSCFRTGKVDGSCCDIAGAVASGRVYHVTL